MNQMEVSMAGTAMAIPAATAKSRFWDSFQQLACLRVRECNALAGEQVWIAAAASSSSLTLIVRSITSPADSVACSFNVHRGILTCSPGPEIKARKCQFHLVDETSGTLRRGSEELTLDEAIDEILGQLVWAHE
jgi:hypothetical protein